MTNFWQQLPKPFYVLAPMEAVTDVVFRHVVERAGRPDVYFTEFTNATGWVHAGDKATGGRLIKTDDEQPIVAQLWGSDPDAMAVLSKHCAKLGYHGIDINMGCPDKAAIKAGGGAGMIRTPDLAYAMVSAAKSSGLAVSVKTRLGYSSIDEWRDWLGGLLQHDLTALTIHLRTKKEMSKVDAHYELIPAIKQLRDEIAPQTLLIINGDIRDRQHGQELVDQYGVDGIMIGRGVFQNPFCFAPEHRTASDTSLAEHKRVTASGAAAETPLPSYASLRRSLGAGPASRSAPSFEKSSILSKAGAAPPTATRLYIDEDGSDRVAAKFDLLHYHLDLYDQYQPQLNHPFETLKRFFKIYINSFDGAAELRDKLMRTSTTAEVRQVLRDHTREND